MLFSFLSPILSRYFTKYIIFNDKIATEDLNVKVYGRMDDDGRQVMAKVHMAFGLVS
jgi:hypothetical protein